MSRCTGHCCEKFYLPYLYEEIQQRTKENPNWVIPHGDAAKIVEMIIPLTDVSTCMDGSPVKPGDENHYYTCKWFDKESRNCTNYENRPALCSGYPYGKPCTIKNCTWSEACEVTKLSSIYSGS